MTEKALPCPASTAHVPLLWLSASRAWPPAWGRLHMPYARPASGIFSRLGLPHLLVEAAAKHHRLVRRRGLGRVTFARSTPLWGMREYDARGDERQDVDVYRDRGMRGTRRSSVQWTSCRFPVFFPGANTPCADMDMLRALAGFYSHPPRKLPSGPPASRPSFNGDGT